PADIRTSPRIHSSDTGPHRRLRRHLRQGVEQRVESLLLHHPADVADHRTIHRPAALLIGTVDLRVDPELRDQRDRAAVTLAPQHYAGVAVADDRRRGRPVVVALQQAEGWRVAPVNVLPGEEDRLRASAPGQPGGVGRHEVVRLLVDVDNVRPELAYALAQPGVVVDVVVAVEAHRLDDEFVAVGVHRLQGQLTDAILVPRGWHDQTQLDAGEPGKLLDFLLVDTGHQRLGEHQDAHQRAPTGAPSAAQ